MNGDNSQQTPAVPGAPVTPPTFATNPQQDPNYQRILQMVMQAAKPKPQLVQPTPAPIPQGQQGGVPGYMQGAGWGFERFANQMQGTIKNAWSQHKQQQLAKAEGDWNILQTGIQMQSDQDPMNKQKGKAMVDAILGDPKKLKEMSKALNQDWMNPKDSVYYQALKSSMKKQQMQQQQKASMLQKLKSMFGGGQMQLNPQQQQGLSAEMQQKMPVTMSQPDVKELAPVLGDIAKTQIEANKDSAAEKRQQEKEEFDTWNTETTQKFNEWKTNSQQQFQQRMQTMRDDASERRQSEREMATLQALGIKLSQKDKDALTIKPSEINKELNESLKDMRQQFSQAEGQLKSLRTETSNHPFYSKLSGVGKSDIDAAQATADNLKKSIAYIESHRSAIVSGKEEMGTVLDKAQEIASGSPDLSDLGGTKSGNGQVPPKGAP